MTFNCTTETSATTQASAIQEQASEDIEKRTNVNDLKKSMKHPAGFPTNIERMFETFHQSPSGDFKPTFYNPFEIKHRRRTSKDQFQILETSFQDCSKPNAAVRRSLAAKLGMTPRAVQVWFQNRRAKLKTLPSCPQYTSSNGLTVDQQSPLDENCTQGLDYIQRQLANCSTSSTPMSPAMPSVVNGADISSHDSSMASPEPPLLTSQQMRQVNAARVAKKGLGSRRHSMPNMLAAPKITTNHFKQLHEAIFGPVSGSPRIPGSVSIASSLNYQVPIKQSPRQSTTQSQQPQQAIQPPSYDVSNSYPQYYQPQSNAMMQKRNNSACAGTYLNSYLNYGMMPTTGMEQPLYEADPNHHHDQSAVGSTELDLFLQSIIMPQGQQHPPQQHQQQLNGNQQQMYLSHLISQADPTQLANMSETLASFLCSSTAPGNVGNSLQTSQCNSTDNVSNDSYLLSKYMNDERFE